MSSEAKKHEHATQRVLAIVACELCNSYAAGWCGSTSRYGVRQQLLAELHVNKRLSQRSIGPGSGGVWASGVLCCSAACTTTCLGALERTESVPVLARQ
eukprot:8708-Heterococcus_DN1.PRE.1